MHTSSLRSFELKNTLGIAIRSILLGSILSGMSNVVCAAEINSNVEDAQYIQIGAGSLDEALTQLAGTTHTELSYDPLLVSAKKTQGLNGQYTFEQGIIQLLKGTGLTLIKRHDATWGIIKSNDHVREVGQLQSIHTVAQLSTSDFSPAQLPVIQLKSDDNNGSAKNGYLIKKIIGAGIWGQRSVQDTPYSMNIISSEMIENNIAQNMDQIYKINPMTQPTGTNIIGDGDTRSVNIRGFSSQLPIINGISYASERTTTPMMQDIERVEIINGATGFLYGGGRVGGAVNFITKKPTDENLKSITVGSYGRQSYFTSADISGKIDQANIFGYRINALYQNGELPSTVDKDQKSISLVLDWKPTDDFYADLKYAYKNAYTTGNNVEFYTTQRNLFKSDQSYTPYWVDDKLKSNRFESNIKWNINDAMSLRSGITHEENHSRYATNYISDGILPETFNQMMFKSNWQQAKNSGAYLYLDNRFNTAQVEHTLTVGYALNNFKSYRVPGWIYQQVENVPLTQLKDTPWTGTNDFGGERLIADHSAYRNILIGDDLHFNDQWSALVGGNYATVIQKNYDQGLQISKYEKSALTPTLSLIYKPIPDLTTYVTYIESLENGGIVSDQYLNAGTILQPLISKQYEIGAKYSVNDHLLLTTALFRIEKANQYTDYSTSPLPTLTQDGQEIHQGVELGITGKITEQLTLVAGGTLMQLSLDKVDDASIKDKKPINTASNMAKIYAEYNLAQIEGLTFSAGAYYTGKFYADSANTDTIPAYTLFDAGVRYATKLATYPATFNLTLQNIANKTYWVNANSMGDPRTIAFSVNTKF